MCFEEIRYVCCLALCLLVASLFRIEERGSRFLHNVSKFIPAYTVSHSRQHFCWVKLWFNSCVQYRSAEMNAVIHVSPIMLLYPSTAHLLYHRLMEECGIEMYCDLHAHLRKHSIFIYG